MNLNEWENLSPLTKKILNPRIVDKTSQMNCKIKIKSS